MPAAHRADRDVATIGGREVTLATFGGRLLARLIDAVIIGVPWAVVFSVVPMGLGVRLGLVLATWAIYDALCWSYTPGKRLAHVKVVLVATGEQPGPIRVLARSLVLNVLTWLLNAVVAFFDERLRRGLHDFVARTVVVDAGKL